MSDHIQVSQQGMTALQDLLAGSARGIQDQLDALDAQVVALRGQWTGSAQEAYDTAHREWSISLDVIKEALAAFAASTGTASDTYQQTERANSSAWN